MWKNRLRAERVEQPAVSHLHTNELNQPEEKLPTIKVKDLADVGSASIPLQNETEMLQQPAGPLNIQQQPAGRSHTTASRSLATTTSCIFSNTKIMCFCFSSSNSFYC